MSRSLDIRALMAISASLWVACSAEPEEKNWLAPTAPRATLLFEVASIGIGEVGVVELAVVTPPHHQVRPFRPPAKLAGFWLLDAEAAPIERQRSRWIHRTRIRVRAREVGNFLWPAGTLEVEGPDGSLQTLRFESLPLEVRSVIADFPRRDAPFGARGQPPPPRAYALALAAAGGALTTLFCVGMIGLLRHRTRRRKESAKNRVATTPTKPPWVDARATLAAARETAATDPRAAASETAVALRRYTASRFRTDADTRTTEELVASAPPLGATSRWPLLVEILRGLDALRFPAPGSVKSERDSAAAVEGWIAKADGFVADSVPPELKE